VTAAKKVDLVVPNQAFDPGSTTGCVQFHMLASIGEFERNLINEFTAEGIAHARTIRVCLALNELTKLGPLRPSG
jgi:DNA invertase Pin-like site-specific DNA recombinase